jgi:hypothetical protein
MYKKFQKYRDSNPIKKQESTLHLTENYSSEITNSSFSDPNMKNYHSRLKKMNKNSNFKKDSVIVERWKQHTLSQYLPPANAIHSIINTINQDAQTGIEFYFLEGAECYHKNQISLILFGKVKSSKGEIEAKILIQNPKRLIYIFPKRGAKIEDVEQEVRDKLGNDQKKVKITRVHKKYCFEINLDYR